MNPRLAALLLGLVLLLVPAPLAAQEGDPPPAGESPGAAEKPAEDDALLQEITGEMMKKVEEIRGLKFKHDVERVWKSREEARLEMLAEIEAEMPAEDLEAASKALAFFGFVKEGTDIKAVFSDFIAAGAGGYYLPKKKVFSLVRGFSLDGSRPIVFHELIHAVEDQYFDFAERTEKYMDQDRDDHNAALHALVEGSARMFENRFVDSEPGLREKYQQTQMEEAMKQMAKLMKLPPALIIGTGIFPYGNGSAFLEQVLPAMTKDGPEGEAVGEFDALAAIYADPPLSTEMILHPEKYGAEPDLPREVRLPDVAAVLGEGWKEVVENSMGEFSTGLALNAYLVPNFLPAQVQAVMEMPQPGEMPKELVTFKGETATAVTGWDGDRYRLYGKGDLLCAVWVSVWDGEADATEFSGTYIKVLGKKYKGAKASEPVEEGGWTRTALSGTRDGVTVVARKGDTVIVAERVPAGTEGAILEALAGSEIVRDPRDTVPKK